MSKLDKKEVDLVEGFVTHVVEERDLLLDDEDITAISEAMLEGWYNMLENKIKK